MRRAARIIGAIVLVAGCEADRPESDRREGPPPEPPSRAAARPTVPGNGTFVDFQWAVEPGTPGERALRLEAYLEAYDPTVHGLEDAVHARFYRIARYRLVRAYYRAGRLAEADSALAILEASDLEVR